MADTVSMVFVRRAISWVKPDEKCLNRILSEAGITPAQFENPELRVPAESFGIVWHAVSRELDDEFFHLDSRKMKTGSFAFLCRSLVAESRFDRALEHCLQGFSVLLDDMEGHLFERKGQAIIRIQSKAAIPENRIYAIELFLTMVHGIMCWLAGRRVQLTRLELDFPRPPHASEYANQFSDSVFFDSAFIEVSFDARWLLSPINHSYETLEPFLRSMPNSVITKFRNPNSMTLRIRRKLQDTPISQWPDVSALAHDLHMAPSTLQRRLASEGASYLIVKAELRRDLAVHLMKCTQKSIQDIAAEVGYQEVSTFYRAFRQWTGRAPGDYRRYLRSA